MIDVLKILLLAGHLLAMNLASAGPLIALLFLQRKEGCDGAENIAARRIVRQSLAAFGLGIVFGSALVALSDESYMAALRRFDARVYGYAAIELMFSALCIVLMALSLRRWPGQRWAAALLASLSALNLCYHFPPFMSVLGKLTSDPNWSPLAVIPRKEMLHLIASHEVIALSFHFVLASFTVASVFALLTTSGDRTSADGQSELAAARRKAAWLATIVTAAQLGIGAWVLTTLEGPSRDTLLGGNLWGTASFAAALFGTLMLLERLAAVGFGDADRAACRRAAAWLIAVVVLMCATLYVVRQERSQERRQEAQKTAAAECLPRLLVSLD